MITDIKDIQEGQYIVDCEESDILEIHFIQKMKETWKCHCFSLNHKYITEIFLYPYNLDLIFESLQEIKEHYPELLI